MKIFLHKTLRNKNFINKNNTNYGIYTCTSIMHELIKPSNNHLTKTEHKPSNYAWLTNYAPKFCNPPVEFTVVKATTYPVSRETYHGD